MQRVGHDLSRDRTVRVEERVARCVNGVGRCFGGSRARLRVAHKRAQRLIDLTQLAAHRIHLCAARKDFQDVDLRIGTLRGEQLRDRSDSCERLTCVARAVAEIVGADEQHHVLRLQSRERRLRQAIEHILGAIARVAEVERVERREIFVPRVTARTFPRLRDRVAYEDHVDWRGFARAANEFGFARDRTFIGARCGNERRRWRDRRGRLVILREAVRGSRTHQRKRGQCQNQNGGGDRHAWKRRDDSRARQAIGDAHCPYVLKSLRSSVEQKKNAAAWSTRGRE